MVERPLSMREVPGSMPGFSSFFFLFFFFFSFSAYLSKVLARIISNFANSSLNRAFFSSHLDSTSANLANRSAHKYHSNVYVPRTRLGHGTWVIGIMCILPYNLLCKDPLLPRYSAQTMLIVCYQLLETDSDAVKRGYWPLSTFIPTRKEVPALAKPILLHTLSLAFPLVTPALTYSSPQTSNPVVIFALS